MTRQTVAMHTFELTGGAKMGNVVASWPFAVLRVSSTQLELTASGIGNVVFQPGDLLSIEPYNGFGGISKGVQLQHRVPGYPQKIIFLSFKEPETIISQIRQTGFMDAPAGGGVEGDSHIRQQQLQGSVPVKKAVLIGLLIVWNVLFLFDFLFSGSLQKGFVPGNGVLAALGLIFVTSLLALVSEKFSRLILKEGKKISHISRLLYLLLFISGTMLMGLLAFNYG